VRAVGESQRFSGGSNDSTTSGGKKRNGGKHLKAGPTLRHYINKMCAVRMEPDSKGNMVQTVMHHAEYTAGGDSSIQKKIWKRVKDENANAPAVLECDYLGESTAERSYLG